MRRLLVAGSVLVMLAGCRREPPFDQRYAAESARIAGESAAIGRDIDRQLQAQSAAHPDETVP